MNLEERKFWLVEKVIEIKCIQGVKLDIKQSESVKSKIIQ